MSRSLPAPGPRARLRWLLATTVVALAGASSAFAQTPGCQITYTAPTWVGGNGFGATIDIRNTGPTINGWNLVFNFPNGQRIQNGWPVTFSQPAGSPTVTVSSNAAWNATINTNASFNVGFNGTFSGANNPPTAFTLNGTACTTGGPQNTAPTVSLTAPTNGQAFPAGTTSVNLAANASDPNGAVVRVEFRVNGNLVNTDTTAPYAFTATGLAAGTHTVTATAVDNGSPALSTTTSVTSFTIGAVNNTPPTVSLTAPTNAQVFPTGTTSVTLSANASDSGGAVTRVEFRVDGALVGTDTTAPYSFTATGLAAGNHTAQATAFDNGNPSLSTSTAAVPFSITGTANTAPQVSVTSPTAGQNFASGATVALSATASDPGGAVVRCEFRVDGNLVATDTTSPYSFNLAGLANGSHSLIVTCFDNGTPSLSTATPARTFTVGTTGNTAPQVTLTAPTSGQSFPAGSAVTLSATASDPGGAVIRVEFRIDGNLVSSDMTSPYSFNATGLAAGSHTVTATAFDNGNPTLSTVSAAVPFTIGATGAVFRVNPQGRITKNGTVFPVRCANWFGLEGRHEPSNDPTNPSGAPMELYVGNTFWANGGAGTGRTIQQTLSEATGMGLNVLRIPVSPQTLQTNNPQGTGSVLKNHPSVRVANSRLALEQLIVAADANNVEVVLDVHSCSNYIGWRAGRLDARPPWVDATRDNYDFTRENFSCAASGNPGTVTTTHPYNTTMWLDTLRTLAGLGTQLGVDNIIGIDIFNEPWDYTWQDWKTLSEQAYTAINSVNPNTLIWIEGISATANNQDGTPATITQVPHGSTLSNPNWGENLFEAGANPPAIPKERLVYSPHTYGPSVFVQKMFMDPAQPQCTGLEGDAAGDADCNIVINPTLLRAGWEEHFGYLRDQGYAVVVGEFGGHLDWPQGGASLRDRARWSHITPGVDAQWQNTFVDYMVENQIEGCHWGLNPESGDTGGWYGHAYDPVSNTAGWGQWLPFIPAKTTLLNRLWGR